MQSSCTPGRREHAILADAHLLAGDNVGEPGDLQPARAVAEMALCHAFRTVTGC